MTHPDLASYTLHKVIDDIDLDGLVVPGLRGTFLRRPVFDRAQADRIATVGVYAFHGERVFMAWGYVGEAHCRFTAVREGHGWGPAQDGCPTVELRPDTLAVRRADGGWLVRPVSPLRPAIHPPSPLSPHRPPPAACTADSGSMAGVLCPSVRA